MQGYAYPVPKYSHVGMPPGTPSATIPAAASTRSIAAAAAAAAAVGRPILPRTGEGTAYSAAAAIAAATAAAPTATATPPVAGARHHPKERCRSGSRERGQCDDCGARRHRIHEAQDAAAES